MNHTDKTPAVDTATKNDGANVLPPRRSQELESFMREVEDYETSDHFAYSEWRTLIQDIFVAAELLERHEFDLGAFPEVGELVARAMRLLIIASDAICNCSHDFGRIWNRTLLVNESDLYDTAGGFRHEEGEQSGYEADEEDDEEEDDDEEVNP